jgi:hypothetical protein
MHDDDIELLETFPVSDGITGYRVRLRPLGVEREYHFHAATQRYVIAGAERTIRVGGHDMTSILGKRVREFLESRRTG